MRYLTKSVPVYVCSQCQRECTGATVVTDGYGEHSCPHCEGGVTHVRDDAATFWSVALYGTGRAYGGPEEGGWWYDVGSLIQHSRVRVFEDYEEANVYLRQLWDQIPKEDRRGEDRLAVCGWTERLPERHWPRVRPRYC